MARPEFIGGIMAVFHGLHLRNLRGDLMGGVTAAVVALPLALAFGVASGAGPVAGLYGAIFVGFFAALFGGTPSQVSGPTGPMTVVMAGVLTQYSHEPALAFTVVMLGGLFQILFGWLRLGRYISLVSFPVVSGFMTGVGVIIIILQIGPLLGQATPAGGPLGTLGAVPDLVTHANLWAFVLGLIALCIVYLMPARWGRWLPSPLAALLIGSLLAVIFGGVPVLGDIPTGLPTPSLPTFELTALPGMISSALVLALLGSIDSLLTSLVADSMTRSEHQSDRELIGQGIGNTLAGLMGGIPGAGATMRTVINIRSGGQTPISGAFHALVLLAVVLGLGAAAAHIPHAVLAGILIKVGVDILDRDYLGRIRTAPRSGVAVMAVVLFLTVFVDLITAVAVGVVMESLLLVKRMADLQEQSLRQLTGAGEPDTPLSPVEQEILDASEGRIVVFHLNGPMSFGAVKAMARRLGAFDHYDVMLLDLTDVPLLDTSAAMGIEDMLKRAQQSGRHLFLVGLTPKATTKLEKLGVFKFLPDSYRFGTRLDALIAASNLVISAEILQQPHHAPGHQG